MRLNGSDRDIAIGVLHGFLLGKKGTAKYSSEQLVKATDQFIEHCLDNHKAKAVESLSKFVK